jgi:hypothetical protein
MELYLLTPYFGIRATFPFTFIVVSNYSLCVKCKGTTPWVEILSSFLPVNRKMLVLLNIILRTIIKIEAEVFSNFFDQ